MSMGLIRADARHLPLATSCVDCVVTSPPYWGLRDYGHGDQIGLEPTPDAYVAQMVAVFREVRRVLKDTGTVWLNLGDSYIGGGRGGDADDAVSRKQSTNRGSLVAPTPIPAGMKAKDLAGIPWRVAFALQTDGWYLRSDIIWSKPNPMPESVTDRPTKAHEYVFLLAKSKKYYYDAAAIAEPASWTRENNPDWQKQRAETNARKGAGNRNAADGGFTGWQPEDGRNKRTVWTVNTQPYAGAHFATMPESLVEPCILAGTSAHGNCAACGAPWSREIEKETVREHGGVREMDKTPLNVVRAGWRNGGPKTVTLGWQPTCACGTTDVVPALVCDPFMGSGTVGAVAERLGRRWVGTDINEQYHALAKERTAQIGLKF